MMEYRHKIRVAKRKERNQTDPPNRRIDDKEVILGVWKYPEDIICRVQQDDGLFDYDDYEIKFSNMAIQALYELIEIR